VVASMSLKSTFQSNQAGLTAMIDLTADQSNDNMMMVSFSILASEVIDILRENCSFDGLEGGWLQSLTHRSLID